MTMGRTDGALARVITPIGQTETEADAEARLQRFLTDAIDRLPDFVPE
jgi:hypothetical protein